MKDNPRQAQLSLNGTDINRKMGMPEYQGYRDREQRHQVRAQSWGEMGYGTRSGRGGLNSEGLANETEKLRQEGPRKPQGWDPQS